MQVLPVGAHAALDLGYAAAAAVLPRRLGWSRRSARLLAAVAVVTLASSLLTRYPLGVVRRLPLTVHLIVDGILALALFCAQFLLTEEESEVRAAFAGLGLLGALSAALTRRR